MRFKVHLESASVDLILVQEECDDIVRYIWEAVPEPCRRRLQGHLVETLQCCIDAKEWTNVWPSLSYFVYLPMANGWLERVFSQLKLIKNYRRTCLKEDTLDQLL